MRAAPLPSPSLVPLAVWQAGLVILLTVPVLITRESSSQTPPIIRVMSVITEKRSLLSLFVSIIITINSDMEMVIMMVTTTAMVTMTLIVMTVIRTLSILINI